MKTLLNELTARSEEFKDPLVNRTIADLQMVQQELWQDDGNEERETHLFL